MIVIEYYSDNVLTKHAVVPVIVIPDPFKYDNLSEDQFYSKMSIDLISDADESDVRQEKFRNIR